jgi:hypothetical protein
MDGWWYLPSPEVPVRYAMSGIGSLYGYAASGVAHATLNDVITIPDDDTNGGPFLNFRLRTPSNPNERDRVVPVWQVDDVNDPDGWRNVQDAHNALYGANGHFFSENTISVWSFRGKTIRLRLEARGPLDYVIDDVSINSCGNAYSDAPYDVWSQWTGTTAVLQWTQHADHDLVFTFDPPIVGAPTFLPRNSPPQSGPLERSLTLHDLDPSVAYVVTIRSVHPDLGPSARSVTVELRSQPSDLCLTSRPLPFSMPVMPKPQPGEGCGSAGPVPRKTDR